MFCSDTTTKIGDRGCPGWRHRISEQTLPTLLRPIARAAPRDKSMSRLRVNGPRSLIITTVEAPVRGFVTFTRVPNGRLLCAAVTPSGRNAWPLAVCRPELYWVAFIEPVGQVPWVDPARAMPPNQVETSNRGMMILNAIVSLSSGCVSWARAVKTVTAMLVKINRYLAPTALPST
jgi:hypothetical protein